MRLLGIETATGVTAVALCVDGEVDERRADEPRRHTEALAPLIAAVLAAHGRTTAVLDGIVVDVGPGLFTGLRVGIATAKGLSVASGVGLHAVTSTDVLAWGAWEHGVRGELVCVVDARRAEVFAASHHSGDHGVVARVAPAVVTPAALATQLAGMAARPTLAGDGAIAHRAVLSAGGELRDDLAVPSAATALRLVQRRIASGETAVAHGAIHPVYLRDADAIANFTVRDGS